MKTSDIPERPILELLAKHQGEWCTWGNGYSMPTVSSAMPPGLPDKLQLSKMRNLIKRGLVAGCDCGCRGDFEITNKGLARINALRSLAMICPTTPDEERDFVRNFVTRIANPNATA